MYELYIIGLVTGAALVGLAWFITTRVQHWLIVRGLPAHVGDLELPSESGIGYSLSSFDLDSVDD